jgi:hypothetical protein
MKTRSQAAAATLDAFAPATPPARVASRKRGAPEPAGPRLTGPSGLPHDTLRVIIGMLDAASASSLRATCKELKGLTVREGEGVVVGEGGQTRAPSPITSAVWACMLDTPPSLREGGGAGGSGVGGTGDPGASNFGQVGVRRFFRPPPAVPPAPGRARPTLYGRVSTHGVRVG